MSSTITLAARPLPEAIELAERWREAGKVLSARAPDVFEEMLALFATWIGSDGIGGTPQIDKIYQVT